MNAAVSAAAAFSAAGSRQAARALSRPTKLRILPRDKGAHESAPVGRSDYARDRRAI